MLGMVRSIPAKEPGLTKPSEHDPEGSRALRGARLRALSPGLYRAASRLPARNRRALAPPN